MATALEEKIENLGTKLTRLAAENKKIIKERERKCQPSLDLGFPSRDSGSYMYDYRFEQTGG